MNSEMRQQIIDAIPRDVDDLDVIDVLNQIIQEYIGSMGWDKAHEDEESE